MEPNYSFPCEPGGPPNFGLTKRELFAAMAMQGMLASPDLKDCERGEGTGYEALADMATGCADALLAELAKGEPE